MGKFRPRVKGKGKRWRKGHSSSSNPDTKKHRNAARSRFFQENLGQGNLTSDALKKFNAVFDTKNEANKEMSDEEMSFGGTFRTFQTFASDWSACSNVSFNRLLNGFRSDSALHKEMLAVLAAVTEVIKTNGGKETTTEYFAALMTTLDATETEDSVTAVVSLLGMGIKSVPQNVLQFKFSEASKTFMDILAKYANSDNNVILRSLIGCLSVLLRAQETAVWNSSSTLQVFDSVLAFTTHSKPKVRKAAQHAVCAILKGSRIMLEDNHPPHHPAAAHTAKFCVQQVESGGSLGGSTTTLHILTLLKEILATFPKAQLKATCESILKVMTLGNILVTSCGMQALYGLFVSQPPVTSLPASLNAQLITALFDYQPAASDTQPTLAWVAVMQEGYVNLGRCDLSLCCANLPRLFIVLTQLWLAEKPEVMSGATRAMEAVVQSCVHQACSPDTSSLYQHNIEKVITTVTAGLQYQYHSAWQHVLHLLAVLFEAAGETCLQLFKPCLKTLGELRDSEQFSYRKELEFAVGKAVRVMGPEAVLSLIPLQITGQETNFEFRRSWMLPVLKDNIQRAPLKFFVDYFLPLAVVCRKRSLNLGKDNQIAAHSYDLLQSQIWALLPSFCNNPPDVKENFKGIAKVLGTAIGEYKDLRLSAMASLRKLISRNKEMNNQENLNELKRFAKNYLPILFNLYTTKPVGTDEEGHRLAAFETIKVYLTLASPELCAELFVKASEKLNSPDIEPFLKESVLDLLRALLPYQDSSHLATLFNQCQTALTNPKNHHEQKKAYRLLEELCSSDSEGCQAFVTGNLPTLQQLLLKSLSKSAPSSKGPRLRCLIHILRRLQHCDMSLLQQIVPEAVICCKDINERCRTAAYSLLIQIGEGMQKWLDKPTDDIIKSYLGLLMAGLAGSPTLASATLLAIAKITHQFRESMPVDLLTLLLDNVTLLVMSNTREIVGAALSFIKVFITSFPLTTIGPSVPAIMKSLVGMTDNNKRHFRTKCRDILDRLVRKFSYEAISDLVPASDTVMHKRLRNLRKIHARKKQQKIEDRNKDSDDDDEAFAIKSQPKSIDEILAESDESDMEVDTPSNTKSGPKKKRSAWIKEDADTIVDFTDVSASKRITATHPAKVRNLVEKKKKSSEFKVASDGRLIIADDSDSEEETTLKNKRVTASDSESDAEDDGSSVKTGPIKRKRRLSMSTDATSEPPAKYQAGGTGIHRPIAKAKSKKAKNANIPGTSLGAEYRAKKAKGDIKRKGLPDPYAYLPLSRKFLNKRKKMKHAGQFTNLVRAAKTGARKGSKAKGKMAQRRK
ncbi:RRP12-like protein [Anabrus simplex]|uniref:RRP12-like protein n=1 Tax=Anabrus simplex TaxID=316456 RepID=UPI0035A3B3F2